jgi:hypothetical protein
MIEYVRIKFPSICLFHCFAEIKTAAGDKSVDCSGGFYSNE